MPPHAVSSLVGRASMLALLGTLAGPAAAAPVYHLVDLGPDTSANDINRHGVIAGARNGHAAMWRADGWHSRAGADSVTALDGQGEALGLVRHFDVADVSVYWPAGGGAAIPITMPFDTIQVLAYGVESGRVAGFAEDTSNRTHCFVWTAADGTVDLGTGGHDFACYAVDINASGQVVGYTPPPDPLAQDQAFIWQDGQFTFLGTLPGGHWSQANAINRRGHVAVTTDRLLANGRTGERAALWTGTRLKDLGTVDQGTEFQGLHLNDRDEVLGQYYSEIRGWRAFLYTEGQMYRIDLLVDNLDGVDIRIPTAIGDDGTLVGTFIDDRNVTHAYRLERVAESAAPAKAPTR